jgi:hypothetical protein
MEYEHIAIARNNVHAIWLLIWHTFRHPRTSTFIVLNSDIEGM